MNTGGQAFPGPHWSEGETGMTLLDWMAGQETIGDEELCAEICEHHAGPRPTGDWRTSPVEWHEWEARWRAGIKYMRAAAMLTEKARREADHSGDANKMVQGPTAADNERWARFQDGIRIAFSPTGGWSAEIGDGSMSYGDTIADAILNLRARWEEKNVVPDHSPDAGRMVELQAANREFAEALEALTLVVGLTPVAGNKEAMQDAMDSARAILAKHKGAA